LGCQLLWRHFGDANLTLFSTQIGVTREFARQLLAGIAGPGVRVAFAIEDASLGRIPARAWTQPASRTP
jgi:hypothetical protein